MRLDNPDYIPSIGVEHRSLNLGREGDRSLPVNDRVICEFKDGTLRYYAGERSFSSCLPEIIERVRGIRADGKVVRRVVFFCTSSVADITALRQQNFERDNAEEMKSPFAMLAFSKTLRS